MEEKKTRLLVRPPSQGPLIIKTRGAAIKNQQNAQTDNRMLSIGARKIEQRTTNKKGRKTAKPQAPRAKSQEPRGAKDQRKRRTKKRRTYLPTFFEIFEIFRSDFEKYFYGVLGLLMQRNGQKRYKKSRWEKTKEKSFFSSTFSAKSF
jgi:hypothetical protein